MKKFITLNVLIVVVTVVVLFSSNIISAEEPLEFDKDDIYDVYCQTGEDSLIVFENVHIKGVKDLYDIKFMVVHEDNKNFLSNDQDAFIDLNCIKSVSPSFYKPKIIKKK